MSKQQSMFCLISPVSISKIPQDLIVIKHGKESKHKCASNQTSLPSKCHIGDV